MQTNATGARLLRCRENDRTAAVSAEVLSTVRPKILFVSQQWPADAGNGAQQRAINVGRLLARVGDVSFLIVSPEPENAKAVQNLRSEFKICGILQPSLVPRKKPFERLRRRLRHEFYSGCIATEPWALSKVDRSTLLRLIEGYNVIWVHNVKAANLTEIYRWPRSILDLDDIPSRYFKSLSQSRHNPVRRLLDLRMSSIWKRRERHLRERFDVLAVCSEQDRQYLSEIAEAHVIPNGFKTPAAKSRILSERPRIGFVGMFTYRPNQEGMRWFIRYVWPRIRREHADAELRLVGGGSDEVVSDGMPGIAKLGWMDDPSDEIATWSAMVVPIQFGGGTRVKIAEGFARKCPVVSTTIGAFGYDVRNREEILLADTPEEFASACVDLCQNPELGKSLSERAHQQFLRQWTWDSLESAVAEAVEECISRAGSAAAAGGKVSARAAARHAGAFK